MTISKASLKLPKNVSNAQDHLFWSQMVQQEDQGHRHSLYEGIKLGVVTKVRLDEIFERTQARQLKMRERQQS